MSFEEILAHERHTRLVGTVWATFLILAAIIVTISIVKSIM